MKKRIYINDDWKFTESFSDGLVKKDFDDSGLEKIRLPHTCKEVPFHYFDEHIYQMISGYRKVLFAPKEWIGKKVVLTFDGIGHESTLYINGKEMYMHHCGYTSFSVEITDELKYEEDNIIAVKVNSNENINVPPFGFVIDYMTFGGIYRDAYIDINDKVSIDDIFVRSVIDDRDINGNQCKKATLKVTAEISGNPENSEIVICINNKEIKREKAVDGINNIQCEVSDTTLWSTDNPVLYDVGISLISDKTVLDEKNIRFGFRKAEFKVDGFYLNGKKFKIRGLNRHQSYPYVGYAMPESMQKLDAEILKNELHLNAVRTSHYPQSHYFIDKCDEIGLLVFTEIPGWQHIGNEEWKLQAIENVKDMVKQYRNHTSIILWGVRINESVDDDDFYIRTNKACHELDDSRQTGGVRCYKKSNLLEDVYTYNDFIHNGKTKGCDKKSDVTSNVNKPYMITEYNGHMFPTKPFDCEEHRVEHALRHANVINEVAKQTDISGSFGWCMFDYNTHKDFGSGDRICYHGVMDMFRNPKIASFVYAAEQDEEPVLEISSSMDIGEHPGCNRGEIYIFTNADSVKMYKNNILLHEYTKDESPYKELKHGPIPMYDYIGDALAENESFSKTKERLLKEVLNETAKTGLYDLSLKSKIKAARLMLFHGVKQTEAVDMFNHYVGSWGAEQTVFKLEAIKGGKVVKTLCIEPMKNVLLDVNVSSNVLAETNSYDMAAVRISAIDDNGNKLFYFNDAVELSAEGPIEIVGPDVTTLQGGAGGTYVKTTGEKGKAKLILKSAYTKPVEIEFEVK